MQSFNATTDFNGFVLFDPSALIHFCGGAIAEGTNLWHRFATSDDGDRVVDQGIMIPVLGINDGAYALHVRSDNEASAVTDPVIVENGLFPLQVCSRLVFADLAVLLEWEDESGWIDVVLRPGLYAVRIRGFRRIENKRVTHCGFEFVHSATDRLPNRTGSLETNMQVLTLER
jgi:hypothetical protein